MFNLTADAAGAQDFVTAYPCGAAVPVALNLNYIAGETIANLVVAPLDHRGHICLYNEGDTHLVLDAAGYLEPGAVDAFHTPARLLDTRPGTLSVTVDDAVEGGYLTVHPTGVQRPIASNLNYDSADQRRSRCEVFDLDSNTPYSRTTEVSPAEVPGVVWSGITPFGDVHMTWAPPGSAGHWGPYDTIATAPGAGLTWELARIDDGIQANAILDQPHRCGRYTIWTYATLQNPLAMQRFLQNVEL